MTPLLLVRHGETDWNASARIQGQRDIPLNAKGRWQAERAARVHAIVTRSDCWTAGSTVTYGGIARRDPLNRREIAKLDGSAED